MWAAAKNSGPSSRYATMCSASSACSSALWSPGVERHLLQPGGAGHRAQRQDDGHGQTDGDGGDQVQRP